MVKAALDYSKLAAIYDDYCVFAGISHSSGTGLKPLPAGSSN